MLARYFEGGQRRCHQNEGGVSTFNSENRRLISEIARKRGGGQRNNFDKGIRESLQNKMLPENGPVETREAGNLTSEYSIYAEHDFDIPEA